MKLVTALKTVLDIAMEHPTYTEQEIREEKDCAEHMNAELNAFDRVSRFIGSMQNEVK